MYVQSTPYKLFHVVIYYCKVSAHDVLNVTVCVLRSQ